MDEKISIQLVSSFMLNHGYIPRRIKQNAVPQGKKSPDFEIYEEDSLKFLCELKTLDLTPNPATNMFHWNTTVSKIREHTSTASKQFTDHDNEHKFPRILFFISTHFQLNWTNLIHSIQGAVAYNGQVIKDLRNQRFIQSTEKEQNEVDIFIWGQTNAEHKKIYQMAFFINANSKYIEVSNIIVDKLIPYEDENISGMNTRKYKRMKDDK